jgi:hypothetical protein
MAEEGGAVAALGHQVMDEGDPAGIEGVARRQALLRAERGRRRRHDREAGIDHPHRAVAAEDLADEAGDERQLAIPIAGGKLGADAGIMMTARLEPRAIAAPLSASGFAEK